MTTRSLRKIVKIDEERCDGCGVCVPACAEGALQIIDGKARLVSETYCDGLGACLGECPQDAISIEEREAEGFDEEVSSHLQSKGQCEGEAPSACASMTITRFERGEGTASAAPDEGARSALSHFPIQLALVPPTAPFLQGAELLLSADCVPFACADFHPSLLQGRALLVACPKLDDLQTHHGKLTDILRSSGAKGLTVAHMEVPCCSGLMRMAEGAIAASGRDMPLTEVTVGMRGEILP